MLTSVSYFCVCFNTPWRFLYFLTRPCSNSPWYSNHCIDSLLAYNRMRRFNQRARLCIVNPGLKLSNMTSSLNAFKCMNPETLSQAPLKLCWHYIAMLLPCRNLELYWYCKVMSLDYPPNPLFPRPLFPSTACHKTHENAQNTYQTMSPFSLLFSW